MPDSTGCALVTGGSRGIGRAAALRLAHDGHDIALCYRSREDAAAEVAAAIEAAGRRCLAMPCDVADQEAVGTFVKAARAEFGEIGVAVNCAGVIHDRALASMTAQAWRSVIDTNLTGTFNVCRSLVFDLMKRRRGRIVNVSSVAGIGGNAGQTNYSAAKAGIIGFSRSLAKELGPFGIPVNVVAPGFIETDMTSALTARSREQARKLIPLDRFGTVEDVAGVISFLASGDTGYITGQVLRVDGGMVL
ncbi:3-oxoacyl-[acyl-carrier-protein] reductase [Actinomadura barringtoniae]|uniref:3-oxoacyl-[acyl-carrier-protein] reductase n=1 Tax=Actinomadura barringtoniae TaxID=1427535 RepID=A0A939P6N2_9ACTN|nr:3-oxoacyl-[acyl-carrier-protein] reductase [Actinomadura barringtoniae]MBO2445922.1 3-oxoacyl-[acyl-carrier-protein] reductase [Actinomadura barringtoniae]